MLESKLTAVSHAELPEGVQAMYERLGPLFDQERLRIAELLAGKADSELFGQTEYELRDRVHDLGARALEAAAKERVKKGGLRGS